MRKSSVEHRTVRGGSRDGRRAVKHGTKVTRRSFLERTVLASTALSAGACAGTGAMQPPAVSGAVDPYERGAPLTPPEANALRLCAQIFLPEPLPIGGPSIDDVVANLQRFVENADPATLSSLRSSLALLGTFAPLVASNLPALRRDVAAQLLQRDSTPIKAALDELHKVVVLGYYGQKGADAVVGYHRPTPQPLARRRLRISARPAERVFDVAIVGAGVAGSLLAERLTRQGKSVVLLESGPYFAEMDIDTDEVVWVARLQRGSGLQNANATPPYSTSARPFPVLQGACVGGGGVINNAICFQMPDARLKAWENVGFPIEATALRKAYQTVAGEIRIVPVSRTTRHLNPSLTWGEPFGDARVPTVTDPPTPGFWECLVNIVEDGCLGCGLCNTGCGSERKRNALQVYLPMALERDCELVPNATVERVVLRRPVHGVPPRVAELAVRSGADTYSVRAREFVLSAGAVQTTALLLRSPDVVAAAGALPIGKRFFANVASPILALYRDELVHPRAELQLTHYYYPPDPADAFLIEDLYNPPGQAALVMPGYQQQHARRMAMYANTALTGAVVPTSSLGWVSLDSAGNPEIVLPLTEEIDRFRRAIGLISRAMLRRRNGPPPLVIAGSNAGGLEMSNDADVARFERWFTRFDQVALSTGHPQGGSALSADPRIGVVDADFRMKGFDNLRICDGSLFPLAAGVNPQWTIMALTDLCGQAMA
jgi:choline dehydrogenase-like flavoprotein